jgi:hypothetical protein
MNAVNFKGQKTAKKNYIKELHEQEEEIEVLYYLYYILIHKQKETNFI